MNVFLRHLKGTFAVFVTIGVILIVWFSLGSTAGDVGGDRTARDTTMIVVVLSLMILYGVLLWFRTRVGLATDTDGETFYYLGFIFTLATLVAAFMPLLWQTTRVDTKQVLGLFGLGLITTFVGLAGRIFFSQLGDAEEGSEQKLQRLAVAADSAGRSIEAVALQIERTAVGMAERQEAAYGKLLTNVAAQCIQLSNELTRLTQQASSSIETTTATTLSRIEVMFTSIEDRIANLHLPSKELVQQFTKEIQNTASRLKVFGEGVEDTSSKVKQAGASFLETSVSIESASEKLGALGEQSKATSAATQSAAHAYAQLALSASGAAKGVAELGQAVDGGRQAITNWTNAMAQDLQKGGRAFGEFVNVIGQLSQQVRQISAGAQELYPAIEAIVSAVAQAQQAVNVFAGSSSHLSEYSRSSAEAARSLTLASEQLSISLTSLTSGATEQYAHLLEMIRRMEREVVTSQEAVQKVHQQLVASSSFIVGKLS